MADSTDIDTGDWPLPAWLSGGTPFRAPNQDMPTSDVAPTQEQLDTLGVPPPSPMFGLPSSDPTQPSGPPPVDAPILTGAPYAPTPSAAAGIDQAADSLPPQGPPVGAQAPTGPVPTPAPPAFAGQSGPPPVVPFDLGPPGSIQGLSANLQLPGFGVPPPGQSLLNQPPIPEPGPREQTQLLAQGVNEHALAAATNPFLDDKTRGQAWTQLSPAEQNQLLLHADENSIGAIGSLVASGQITDPKQIATYNVVSGNLQQMVFNRHRVQLDTDYQNQLARIETDRQRHNALLDAQSAQNLERAKQIGNSKIELPHGIGHLIESIVLSGIGGAMSQYTGGRNLALEQLDKATENSIAVQKANIENAWKGVDYSGNLIAQEYARTGSMAQAEYTYQQAMYQASVNTLTTKMQDYAPDGTTFARMSQQRDQILQASHQAAVEVADKNAQASANLAKTRAEALNVGYEAELKKAKVAASLAGPAPRRIYTKDDLVKAGFAPEVVAALPATGLSSVRTDIRHVTDKDIKEAVEQNSAATELATKKADLAGKQTANEVAEAKSTAAAPTVVGTSQEGEPIIETQKMVNKDGTTWRAPEKFQTMLGGAMGVNRLADQLAREIHEWGGQSDLKKSAHWQSMKSDYQDLVFALHQTKGIEGFRPGTSELLHELTGDVDPTSFLRDATSGIQNMKHNINADLNDFATANTYTGKPIAFLNTAAPPPPKKTEVDKAERSAMVKGADKDDREDQDWTDRKNNRLDQTRGQPTPELQEALDKGIAPSKMRSIKTLQAAIENPAARPLIRARSADDEKKVLADTQGDIDAATNAIAAAKKAGDQKAVYKGEDDLSAAKQRLVDMKAAQNARSALLTLTTDAPDKGTRDYAQSVWGGLMGSMIPDSGP